MNKTEIEAVRRRVAAVMNETDAVAERNDVPVPLAIAFVMIRRLRGALCEVVEAAAQVVSAPPEHNGDRTAFEAVQWEMQARADAIRDLVPDSVERQKMAAEPKGDIDFMGMKVVARDDLPPNVLAMFVLPGVYEVRDGTVTVHKLPEDVGRIVDSGPDVERDTEGTPIMTHGSVNRPGDVAANVSDRDMADFIEDRIRDVQSARRGMPVLVGGSEQSEVRYRALLWHLRDRADTILALQTAGAALSEFGVCTPEDLRRDFTPDRLREGIRELGRLAHGRLIENEAWHVAGQTAARWVAVPSVDDIQPRDLGDAIAEMGREIDLYRTSVREFLQDGRDHLTVSGTFQSDKYPWCPSGFVPLKLTDPMTWKPLCDYAVSRSMVDMEFTRDLIEAVRNAMNDASGSEWKRAGSTSDPKAEALRQKLRSAKSTPEEG